MSRFRKALYLLSCGLLFALVLNACADATASNTTPTPSSTSTVLNVVAGENFWGSIATQLGGTRVSVTSIVNDPNADPHQYEGSTRDARAFAQANYVILNGAGYDTWGQKLLDANPVSGRKVFTLADLLGKHEGDNPHFWYNPSYVEQVSNQITKDYQALDPADSAYFTRQRAAFETALGAYHQRIAEIKSKFGGQKVGATESIFVYLANALGLDLISPPEFMQAVSVGNDPPASSVVAFEQQVRQKQIRVLVYNVQTVINVTSTIKQLASQQNIPLAGVSETIPPSGASFQEWQTAQLLVLQNALNASAPGK